MPRACDALGGRTLCGLEWTYHQLADHSAGWWFASRYSGVAATASGPLMPSAFPAAPSCAGANRNANPLEHQRRDSAKGGRPGTLSRSGCSCPAALALVHSRSHPARRTLLTSRRSDRSNAIRGPFRGPFSRAAGAEALRGVRSTSRSPRSVRCKRRPEDRSGRSGDGAQPAEFSGAG